MSSVSFILPLALSLTAAGRSLIFEPAIRSSVSGRGAVVVLRCGEPLGCGKTCILAPDCPELRVLQVAPGSRSLEFPEEFNRCVDPRVTVFAYGHGAVNLTPSLSGADDIKVQLPPSVPIATAVWVADTQLLEKAMDEVVHVNWMLSENLAGMHLVPTFSGILPKTAPGSVDDLCGWLEEDQSRIVDAQSVFRHRTLNVYVGVQGAIDVHCNRSTWGKGPRESLAGVIFTSSSLLLTNLSHEVSHAFGLSGTDGFSANGTYQQGHTNNAAGFSCNNTLWRREGLLESHMSIGQVYWANFDPRSLRSVLSAGSSAESACRGGPCLPWCTDASHSGPKAAAVGQNESCEGPPPARFLDLSADRLRRVRNRIMGRLDERSQCHVRRLVAAYETQRGCLSCARDTGAFTGSIADILKDIALGKNEVCTESQLDVTLAHRYRQMEDFAIKNRGRLPEKSIQRGSTSIGDFTHRWRPVFAKELRNRGMEKLAGLAAQSTPELEEQAARAIEDVRKADHNFYQDYLRHAERLKKEARSHTRAAPPE